jgi:hypothetical protein
MKSLKDTNPKVEAITRVEKIAEDKNVERQELTTPKPPEVANFQGLREEIIDLLKQALGIPQIDHSVKKEPLKTESIDSSKKDYDSQNISTPSEKQEPVNNLFDLFKTTNKSDELSERERKSVILKFD